MKAILISAGKGTRLLPLTEELPKCLMPLNGKITVIEQQLKVLNLSNINDIKIILGYNVEKVEKKISALPFINKMNIEVIYNPFFDISNNLISLWMARQFMDDDIITINGDDIFHSDLINTLIADKNDISLSISIKEEYDPDDMKIIHNNNILEKVGKDIEFDKTTGESIGIIKYTKKGALILRKTLDEMVRNKNNHQLFYLKAIQKIIDNGNIINTVEIPSEKWAEIDFHYDLEFIQRNFNRFKEVSSKLFT